MTYKQTALDVFLDRIEGEITKSLGSEMLLSWGDMHRLMLIAKCAVEGLVHAEAWDSASAAMRALNEAEKIAMTEYVPMVEGE